MKEIDGNYLESGGQILRTATALAAIKKIPCHIVNIRKGRSQPGLATQHLLGVQTAAKLCNGWLEGDKIGSQEIKFYPGEITAKDLHIRVGTAASITLFLQAILPISLFAPSPIKLHFHGGGSDVPFSPTFDYFHYVFLKILEKMGAKVEIEILKRGYYPVGGGEVNVKIFPSKLHPINLTERGGFRKILIVSGTSESLAAKRVGERQVAGVREVLRKLKLPIEEKVEYYETSSPGSQINIIGEFENTVIAVDNLGRLGKSAEQVGREAAESFLKEGKFNAGLDKHLGDQILPFMALAPGKSQVTVSEITNHCKTNIWVIEKFLEGKFKITDNLITWQPAA